MWTKRDLIIFFAGAEAFHTFSHIVLSGSLPITIWSITVTPTFNMWAIILNAAIAIWLFIWASRLEK